MVRSSHPCHHPAGIDGYGLFSVWRAGRTRITLTSRWGMLYMGFRGVVTRVAIAGALAAMGSPAFAPPAAAEPPLVPTPRAACGPGAIPEPGMQGRVPKDEITAGNVKNGYLCNVEILGHQGIGGGFKTERFIDKAGHECAFYDTTVLFPLNGPTVSQEKTGVAVLDMADPSKPVQTDSLETPAMQSPHESMVLNQKRGLLVAVMGNPFFAPGMVDVYDVNADCRHPALQASAPVGLLGHESGFAPDGKTFYASSLAGGTLTAVDVTNPATPTPIYAAAFNVHSLSLSDDGNTAYLAASPGYPRTELGLPSDFGGLIVLDVSEIQARKDNPQTHVISSLTWTDLSIPQNTIPVTIDGHPYIVEMDEYSLDETGHFVGNGPRVGAGRIIDIADPTKPFVVSNLRLEANQRENRAAVAGDSNATSSTQGYAGHYCNVPRRVDPGIVACSFINSGLRVFDIRNPHQPREVAYFVPPLQPGANTFAMSSPAFAPERREVWYADANSAFWSLRLAESVWPTAAKTAAAISVESAAAAAPTATPARPRGGIIPATGSAPPLILIALLLGIALMSQVLLRTSGVRALGHPESRAQRGGGPAAP